MPCENCRAANCPEMECEIWRRWFVTAWEGARRRAWMEMDRRGRREPKGFVYGLPHEFVSPCRDCVCSAWCDTPCAARRKWWDAGMERVRRKMRMES